VTSMSAPACTPPSHGKNNDVVWVRQLVAM
jgi:hypothetical protein